jgi:hypothetical protein
VDPVWATAVTKRLLVILEALSLWSSSSSSYRSDHQGGHGESKESGRVARSSGAGDGDRKYEGSGRRSPSQPASSLLADRRLCVEVSATIKLFISKFAFIRHAFSFRASDLSPPKGADRVQRGDGTWDRRDRDRDLFGRKDETGGGVTVDSSGIISSRVLLMRVLRPTTPSNTTQSSSVRSASSSFSAHHIARQVSPCIKLYSISKIDIVFRIRISYPK